MKAILPGTVSVWPLPLTLLGDQVPCSPRILAKYCELSNIAVCGLQKQPYHQFTGEQNQHNTNVKMNLIGYI